MIEAWRQKSLRPIDFARTSFRLEPANEACPAIGRQLTH